jgi:acyl-CoA thioester hydrolase
VTDPTNLPGQRPGMTPCFWGSVNQWECDENDHLNVRFYAHKVQQAIEVLLTGTDLRNRPPSLGARMAHLHIRFVKEARSATPLRIDCAAVDHAADELTVLALMHQNVSGDVLAAFVVGVDVTGLEPDLPGGAVALPDVAAPRGIDPAAMTAPAGTLSEALAQGFRVVGRGVIDAAECDPDGALQPCGYIGRISDGMPNLWAFLNGESEQAARDSGDLGGAALEQRVVIHRPLTQGAVFSQLSGLRALGNKTQHMVHLIYDHSDAAFAATVEAIGVAMDLATRRAVPISPDRRARLEPLLLRT